MGVRIPITASPEFFDFLVDELGTPKSVKFHLRGEELRQMGERILGDYGMSFLTERALTYEFSGTTLSVYDSLVDFTPDKLKQIYRNQMVRKNEDDDPLDLSLREVSWLSSERLEDNRVRFHYGIRFKSTLISGDVGVRRSDLFLRISERTAQEGLKNELRLASNQMYS